MQNCFMHNEKFPAGEQCPRCEKAFRQVVDPFPPQLPAGNPDPVRKFETGATRSADTGRYDPEGFLSPIAIERYSIYMAKHQRQPDGSIRASDNWQKGLPLATYMKGMWRHLLHLWTRYRGYTVQDSMAAGDMEEDLCALLFNVQGMLHEVVKARVQASADSGSPHKE
jgi:hypothetical protein